MAISTFKLSASSCRPTFVIRSLFYSSQKGPLFLPNPHPNSLLQSIRIHRFLVRWSCASAIENLDESDIIIKPADSKSPAGISLSAISEDAKTVLREQKINVKQWKKLSSRELGISFSAISDDTKTVLKELKRYGYEAYLVGGCVRDLILKRIPKDFDILTTAELREIVNIFPHSEIIGRWFPICHVHVGDKVIEVSSFSSRQRTYHRNVIPFERPVGCDEKDDMRWRNCMQRDFTINGFMFDPSARLVYDYTGGLEDIRKAKVRTIIPPTISFHEDCARILRAIRITARLGFQLAKETAQSISDLSFTIRRLDRGRLMLEMNYMLAYGSAEPSLRLLWKFGLLDILLPHQAAYLIRSGFQRTDTGTNMLLTLFGNLDKLLAPDRPCHGSLWVAILAFHHALSARARDPSVIAAFSLAVNNGGDVLEAIEIARSISRPSDRRFPELLESLDLEKPRLAEQVMDLSTDVSQALSDMTDEASLLKAIRRDPLAPRPNLVFIPLRLYLRASRIFDCVSNGEKRGTFGKQGGKINYEMLASGNLEEARHVFARVVFDTIYPLKSCS